MRSTKRRNACALLVARCINCARLGRLQKDNPGPERESNWLPAPDGGFIPMFRLYWPKETSPSVLDGSWWPPVIAKAG
jgi:hypothetical protein